jgi:hypothetical protein
MDVMGVLGELSCAGQCVHRLALAFSDVRLGAMAFDEIGRGALARYVRAGNSWLGSPAADGRGSCLAGACRS